jgi:hypothetical protein
MQNNEYLDNGRIYDPVMICKYKQGHPVSNFLAGSWPRFKKLSSISQGVLIHQLLSLKL